MNTLKIIAVGILMLFGSFAWCQEWPKAELALQYSYARYNPAHNYSKSGYSLNGFGGAIDYNRSRYLGVKMDLTGYASLTRSFVIPLGTPILPQGGSAHVQGNLFTYLFGPQIGLRYGRVRPFGELLFGGAHSNVYANAYKAFHIFTAAPSGNSFAMLFGGGLDIPITKSESVMIRPGEVGYLLTRFNNSLTSNQNNFRYSAGLVINFGGK